MVKVLSNIKNKSEICEVDKTLVRIQDELGLHKIAHEAAVFSSPAACQDSSPDTLQPPYDLKQGWMTGIFGCLRPVLSIIGKGVVENKNLQDDWEIPFESVSKLDYIGCGGQGVVFYGMLNNTPVAVKKVADLKETDIKTLRKLNHPNIVEFKGVCREYRMIIMEYCPFGPLSDLLKNHKSEVTIQRIVQWAKQITAGMHYLHMHKIIHRDLKSPNVLIGDGEIIKISDFGTSRTWNGVSEKMTFAGTISWMAPEAIKEQACSEKVDIWSFGIVLWELLTCEVPYNGMEQSAIMYSVGTGKLRPPIPKSCPEGFKLLMQMCWKLNPKDRPSFKLILNHLEIASVEILSQYEDVKFFKTQECWKEEIKSQMTQFVEQLKKHQIDCQLKEEQLIKKRENEIQHILDIRELYDKKLEKVNQLYLELACVLEQVKCKQTFSNKKERKRRMIPFPKKIDRRRCGGNQSTTPTSPDRSLTSPDSPQTISTKAPLYAKLNATTETVTTQTSLNASYRKRHSRTNSGSPRSSRTSSSRTSIVVDAETQTDCMDVSENDLSSPTTTTTNNYSGSAFPQRVILQEFKNSDVEEGINNGNCVLHYMASHPQQAAVQVFSRMDSRSPSPNSFDETDSVNKNISSSGVFSDDYLLDRIGRKVSEIKIDSMFDNGNVGDVLGQTIIRKKTASETRDDLDSTEDAANDENFTTDEEGEPSNHTLRRKSLARRPIYPGRRSTRYKCGLNHYRNEANGSDEGNTSEYSVSPSSKSSTLESNPDRMNRLRPNEHSDGSSDSESEENVTIATQVNFNFNQTENVV